MPPSNQSFIQRWQYSAAAERANYALFLSELCDFLDVPRPEPTLAEDHRNHYVFEKTVTFHHLDGTTSTGRIDLYKRAHFILEAKQGSNAPQPDTPVSPHGEFTLTPPALRPVRRRLGTAVRGTINWDEEMLKAYNQAERYAKALPASEGWPPFIVTVDVGYSIELFADFSLTGKAYLPFPDPRSYRILLSQLDQTEISERLRAIWLDPLSLDPSRHTARVTREVAAKLALLARNLEQRFSPKDVAEFLTRCIFTSFAEDVNLLPPRSWIDMLSSVRDRNNVAVFPQMATALWDTMNSGGFSPILQSQILRFNGGLFESTSALALTGDELALLIDAADSDWRDVEPAIFGTLLERALDPDERHALGAHYTPRAYVERLVVPTIVEPLRADWDDVKGAVSEFIDNGHIDDAIDLLREFHGRLCNTRVLDPACGSGNFLYVALEHLKRLEGEVLESLAALGDTQAALEHMGRTVDPHQLLGIDINPRATAVADLVLWIGYLQWHFRTRGDVTPPIPVISNFHNIQCADALMTWQNMVAAVDENGEPVTEWDGRTFRENLLTSRTVPDETARRPLFHFRGAKQAPWPQADFIIGNPPFIGGKDIRSEQVGGYVDALRKVYTEVPDSADFVMYWWQRAAELTREGKCRRFGFITTNSLPQVFNRKVVAQNLNATKNPLSLLFAIPDHPWIRTLDTVPRFGNQPIARAAAVRIAMTVAARGEHEGHLYRVVSEGDTNTEGTAVELSEQVGKIFADLKIGVDVSSAEPLQSNEELSCRGVVLHGSGFIVTPEEASNLGLGRVTGIEEHIRPYLNGRDLTGASRRVMVIDLFGLTEVEARTRYPEVYQWVRDRVKPERDQNREPFIRENWWIFGRPRPELRGPLKGLERYISTVETSKHRIFVFLDVSTLPDNKLVNIALSDAYQLGVLSSSTHLEWAWANRALLEDRPVYVKTTCFDPFPFPEATEAQEQTIRQLAEDLDAHRKRVQREHPAITLTMMYNVLDSLRSGDELNEQHRHIYDAALIGILRDLHDSIDRAVLDAYGWPQNLTTDQLLARIVALNSERRVEEAAGHILWLRPDFQAPAVAVPVARTLEGLIEEAPAAAPRRKQAWPPAIPDQFRAVKESLRIGPATAHQIASGFRPARRNRVAEILATLTALGQASSDGEKYSL